MLAWRTVLSHRISGSLTSFELADSAHEDQAVTVDARARETAQTARRLQNQFTNHMQKALSLFEKGPSGLDSGGGI